MFRGFYGLGRKRLTYEEIMNQLGNDKKVIISIILSLTLGVISSIYTYKYAYKYTYKYLKKQSCRKLIRILLSLITLGVVTKSSLKLADKYILYRAKLLINGHAFGKRSKRRSIRRSKRRSIRRSKRRSIRRSKRRSKTRSKIYNFKIT